MPGDGSDSTMNARTLERAEKLWREAGRPPGGAETYLDEARTVIENWVKDNNEERPHSALGGLTPIEYERDQLRTSRVA